MASIDLSLEEPREREREEGVKNNSPQQNQTWIPTWGEGCIDLTECVQSSRVVVYSSSAWLNSASHDTYGWEHTSQ